MQTLIDFPTAHPVSYDSSLATDVPDQKVMLVAPENGCEMFLELLGT